MSGVKAIRLLAPLIGIVAVLVSPAPASAASAVQAWTLDSFATPTNFSADDNARCVKNVAAENPPCDAYTVRATNVGSKQANNGTITLTDTVPAGVTVRRVAFFWRGDGASTAEIGGNTDLATKGFCTTTPVQCHLTTGGLKSGVTPDDTLTMVVYVTVSEPAVAAPLSNSATISGGGALGASTEEQNVIDQAIAPFGSHLFRNRIAGLDGQADIDAGGHPYELTTRIGFNSVFRLPPNLGDVSTTSTEDPKDIVVDLPLGFVGSTTAVPTCPQAQVIGPGGDSSCPKGTVVGHLVTEPTGLLQTDSPIYNMVPEQGVAAEFAYTDVLGGMHVIYADLAPTPAGYVLRATSRDVPQIILNDASATFFGNPASKSGIGKPVAMFTNPANCDEQPLVTRVHLDSWQNPGGYNADGTPNFSDPRWAAASYESPAVSGCNKLQFNPTVVANPTTNQGDSPTGLDFTIKVPQTTDPAVPATPPLKKAVVTLPQGMSINPSSANGLDACSLSDLGMSAAGLPDAARPHCPDAAKIGTVEVRTPALPGTLEGQIYLARPRANPFASFLAFYIVVDDPTTGVVVKIPGEVKADPVTGQLTTIVDNSPQFPFSELSTHFFAGTRAALRTPAVCGTYEVTSELTPWSAPESGDPATPVGKFEISEGCVESATEEPHRPSFSAGTLTPTAGLYSPLVMNLGREDGSQELKGLDLTLPEGLIGRLAGLTQCSEAQVAAAQARSVEGQGASEIGSPSCLASSEMGTITAGAGAGLTPYYTNGHVYLAGPYKGAPLSAVIITPAVAGPFDLGSVVVRAALQVNAETIRITAASDPLPTILAGIPLDLRSVALRLSRPQFTLNPTSCEKAAVTARALSVFNQVAPLSSPFQVGDCKALGFKPRLSVSLKGGTKRGKNPALKAVFRSRPGDANLASVSAQLPHSEFLDQSHIRTVCTRVQFNAGAGNGAECPAGSIYGRATAFSSLLDAPVQGSVFLRSSTNPLPDLVLAMHGIINATAVARIDSVKGGIRTSFESVPDVQLTKVVLEMQGGKKGLLINSTDICRVEHKAVVKLGAHNGKTYEATPVLKAKCAKKGGKAKRGKRRSASRHG
jgi:hypothetical protein